MGRLVLERLLPLGVQIADPNEQRRDERRAAGANHNCEEPWMSLSLRSRSAAIKSPAYGLALSRSRIAERVNATL
jgi:hypothetical protein